MRAEVVAIIQARMGSSRLPGKVMLPLGDHSVLSWVVRAARTAREVDRTVVATSTEPLDDAIVDECARLGVETVRGSEADVLSRYLLAANRTGADGIVRLTADCPLLDPVLVDQVVSLWRLDPGLDYVSTFIDRTLPRGMDVELATRAALESTNLTATGHDRVHVTSSLYRPGSNYKRCGITMTPSSADLRVTLDEEADYEVLCQVVTQLPDRPPNWRTVVDILRANPGIANINSAVRQKELRDG